jgi:hypothetical protein
MRTKYNLKRAEPFEARGACTYVNTCRITVRSFLVCSELAVALLNGSFVKFVAHEIVTFMNSAA